MGIPSAEFWALDQDEFDARTYFYRETERRWNERFGLIASVYRNAKRTKESDPIAKPSDFFGYESEEQEEEMMSEEQTQKSLEAFVRRFNAAKKADGKTFRTKK